MHAHLLKIAALILAFPLFAFAEQGCTWATIGGCDPSGGSPPPDKICPIGRICAVKVANTEVRVVTSTTGPNGAEGKQFSDGARLAAEDVNKSSQNIQISYRDDQCDPNIAVQFASEALKDKVAAVLGHGCGVTAAAAAPIYRSKLLFLTSSPSTAGGTPSVIEQRFGLSPTVTALREFGLPLLANNATQANVISCEVVREAGGKAKVLARTPLQGKTMDPSFCEVPLPGIAGVSSKVNQLSKRLGYEASSETLRGYSAFWAVSAALNLVASDPKRKIPEVLAQESFQTEFGRFSFGRVGMMSPTILLAAAPAVQTSDPPKAFKDKHTFSATADQSVKGGYCKRLSCEAASSCFSTGSASACNPAAICQFQCN